jgi:hypothetical protein
MDDFNVNVLHESKNEWSCRLMSILTPLIIEGIRSIFDESIQLCSNNGEMDKYLMTFQNFISRIPKWNATIIESEKNRILEKSRCSYLEDLISCVHIIQLKVLTAVRVGHKQKKIDLEIPKLDVFIHKVYIHAARKIYQNVYLFEINIPHLKIQKNNRELEIFIQESILNAIRESIPIDTILKVYMDESIEEDVIEEVKEKEISQSEGLKHLKNNQLPSFTKNMSEEKPIPRLEEKISTSYEDLSDSDEEDNKPGSIAFNDVDLVRDVNNNDGEVIAPKTIERLDDISRIRYEERKSMEDDEDEEDEQHIKLKITDNDVSSIDLGFESLEPTILDGSENLLGHIEEL